MEEKERQQRIERAKEDAMKLGEPVVIITREYLGWPVETELFIPNSARGEGATNDE